MKRRALFFLPFITLFTFFLGAAPARALTPGNLAVSRVGPSSAVLVVKADVPTNVTVDYGYAPGSFAASASSLGKIRHEVNLSGLDFSPYVYYRVTLTNSANPADTVVLPEHGFHESRSAGQPFIFAVAGDNRPSGGTVQPAVWNTIVGQMALENLDLSLNVGDMIYGASTDTLDQDVAKYDGFFAVTSQLTAGAPLYTAVGNHEMINYASNKTGYEQELTLPVNNGAGAGTYGEEYYSFDDGDTHFVSLCTEIPGQAGYVTGNQLQWLTQDLAQTTKRWKVVFLHRPLFGFSGQHPAEPWADLTNVAGQQNRNALIALFKQDDVNVVFMGHEHYYFHHAQDGVQYVITGGGGAPLYPLPALGPGDVYAASTNEHVKVDETATTLKLTAVDSTGVTLESFTLGTPALSLSEISSYWASYADYLARDLSVDYSLANGGGDATGLQLAYLTATNGVMPVTQAPVPLGNLLSGASAGMTVQYLIPQGVTYFRTVSYVTCGDLGGGTNAYPGPPPV